MTTSLKVKERHRLLVKLWKEKIENNGARVVFVGYLMAPVLVVSALFQILPLFICGVVVFVSRLLLLNFGIKGETGK